MIKRNSLPLIESTIQYLKQVKDKDHITIPIYFPCRICLRRCLTLEEYIEHIKISHSIVIDINVLMNN